MLEYIISVCVKFFTGRHHVAEIVLDVLRGLLLFGRHRGGDAVGVVLVGGPHICRAAIHFNFVDSVVHYSNTITQKGRSVKGQDEVFFFFFMKILLDIFFWRAARRGGFVKAFLWRGIFYYFII